MAQLLKEGKGRSHRNGGGGGGDIETSSLGEEGKFLPTKLGDTSETKAGRQKHRTIPLWAAVLVAGTVLALSLLPDALLPIDDDAVDVGYGGKRLPSRPFAEPSKLLAPPLDLMRNRVPLDLAYRWSPEKKRLQPELRQERVSREDRASTVERRILLTHGMGRAVLADLLQPYTGEVELHSAVLPRDPPGTVYPVDLPENGEDFRQVLVLRDLRDSLVSGYLHHRGSGGECRLNAATWDRYLSYDLDPPRDGRSICQYLAEEPESVGMRAYIGTW